MKICVHRLPEEGTTVPKHVLVTLIINCFTMCILLCPFVVQYVGYKSVQGRSKGIGVGRTCSKDRNRNRGILV